ncbi:unnamed protein product [Malus baccata var. baccata]
MGRRRSSPVNELFQWVRRQSIKVKVCLGSLLALCALVALRFWVKNHNYFFIASEVVHVAGIVVLIYKLTTQKTCSGLSLKTQELTALFLAVVPAAVLGVLVHPYTLYNRISRILWAFSAYMEAVSVLPQLRLMQNTKMIEPFTSHYVFALGISRFLACAHWIIQVRHDFLPIYETRGRYILVHT